MAIKYTTSLKGVKPAGLGGFFEGWPNPPSERMHLKLLKNSTKIVLAVDVKDGSVAGFITAVTDGVLCAYIPFLEVRPQYRRRGIGRELVRRMLALLKDAYMVDLMCDTGVQGFYGQLGMSKATGMCVRNHASQKGKSF